MFAADPRVQEAFLVQAGVLVLLAVLHHTLSGHVPADLGISLHDDFEAHALEAVPNSPRNSVPLFHLHFGPPRAVCWVVAVMSLVDVLVSSTSF